MVVAWLILGAVLLLVELHHLAFYLLFAAIGSLAAAGVAVAAPDAVALQASVAVAVALTGVVAVRPLVSRVFEHHHGGHVARGVHGGLAGQEAITLDDVSDTGVIGHVRLAGERWLAVSGSGSVIRGGTAVLVTAVQGTTLVVWPRDDVDRLPSIAVLDEAPEGADGSTA